MASLHKPANVHLQFLLMSILKGVKSFHIKLSISQLHSPDSLHSGGKEFIITFLSFRGFGTVWFCGWRSQEPVEMNSDMAGRISSGHGPFAKTDIKGSPLSSG